ncbi:acyl-CoA dehydrogenase [Vicingus serpentipes]|uniref:Acyl-CoA dehydrogenase n=1 Tax=Vicingus serpentipes TaxID=1926625 RepID=A0A5C6RT95_9FLAO|nr:acyl-CoA dehydrogenase family protein [Vicingus serpentipes]TXB65165.1 acyl-CoA dehydrogenase [Vicingus serpentipes]
MEQNKKAIKGGEFLIKETDPRDVFIPEDFDEEQRMIADTCSDFIKQEIEPNLERIEKQEEGLSSSLMEKAGELGILGVSVPEEYMGFGKNFVTSMLTSEVIGGAHSFAVSISAHTGIGTLPILYYGNAEQREKYVPKLATGEWKAAYCLTEPSSGSDANSAKTKAKLSDDGKHYIINGQKMWITNAGFADVFTVFAKIDDDENLTAFIIEKEFGGITLNPEEKKLGIKGSSTRQVFFNDCKVPVENLLGERQGGFKIALNILNIGRIKLAGSAIGGCKKIITSAVNYANERNQFGRPISKYGAIKHKLGEQAIKVFASESAIYRCSQNIDDAIQAYVDAGVDKQKATLDGISQFAAEAAILKVHGSEVLDFVVDEGVQIYGGMGYSAEAPMEAAYRDARINRIFEGTNEINRMLTVDMLLKKAMKGELDLMGPAQEVAKELMSIPDFGAGSDDIFEQAHETVKKFKKAILMVAGSAAQKLMMQLSKEQEILMNIADMAIETYVAESILLRVEKLSLSNDKAAIQNEIDMMNVYIYDAADKINKAGKDAINSFVEGDELRIMQMGLKRFTKQQAFNVKDARRNIADKLIAENKYCY